MIRIHGRIDMDTAPTFALFGAAHLTTIGLIGSTAVGLPWLARQSNRGRWITPLAWLLAAILILQELGTITYRHLVLADPWAENLPFHLCDLALLIGAATLIRRDARLFQILYYWGLAGTLQAVLTPDLPFGFPDPRYIVFFLAHGLVIVAIGFAVIALDLRPTLGGAMWALAAANLWALLVAAPVNALLGTNYLYLCAKPAQASLMDALGPWPWYLFALEIVGLISFLVYYVLWALVSRLGRKASAATVAL